MKQVAAALGTGAAAPREPAGGRERSGARGGGRADGGTGRRDRGRGGTGQVDSAGPKGRGGGSGRSGGRSRHRSGGPRHPSRRGSLSPDGPRRAGASTHAHGPGGPGPGGGDQPSAFEHAKTIAKRMVQAKQERGNPCDGRYPGRWGRRGPRTAQPAACPGEDQALARRLRDQGRRRRAAAPSGRERSYEPDAIVRHGAVNVGIAVALDGGLIVPVLHNADTLGPTHIRIKPNLFYMSRICSWQQCNCKRGETHTKISQEVIAPT